MSTYELGAPPETRAAGDGAAPRRSETPVQGAARSTRKDIQGLRAVAVLLVVLYHAGLPGLSGGYVGVDVFFVVSGFLMTAHLLKRLRSTGRVGMVDFYARRVRRLFPMALLVVLVTLIAAWFVVPPLAYAAVAREAVAAALFVPNVLFAARGTSYLASHDPSLFQHYWSLGVEEQFYLLWPVGLVLLWWVSRRSLPVLTVLVAGLVGLSLAGCIVLTGMSQPYAFFLLPSRAWELGVGALVALVLAGPAGAALRSAWAAVPLAVVGWVGLALVAVAGALYDDSTSFPGAAAVVPVLGAGLILLAGSGGAPGAPAGVGRVLGLRPLTWVGDISYSLYLWHWPLLLLPAAAGLDLGLGQKLALVAVAVLLSALTTRFVEEPFRGRVRATPKAGGSAALRRLTAGPGAVVVCGLVATALVAGATGLTGWASDQRRLTSDRTAAAWDPSDAPVFPTYVPANLRPSLTAAAADRPAIYDDGCMLQGHDDHVRDGCVFGDPAGTTTVVLFGDSHAGNWMPALDAAAAARSMRLVVYVKGSCAAADVVPVAQGNLLTSCATWRAEVLRRLAADPPAVVVLGAAAGVVLPGDPSTRTARWNEGLARTLAALPSQSRVVAIGDNPVPPDTVNACFSAHLDDASTCWRPRATTVPDEWNRALAATVTAAGGRYTDFTDRLCDQDVCGGIAGDTLLFFDGGHLTATASRALAGVVGQRVLDAA
ncbi:Peptidoglycan/LPS O-acetylase OafA/YrhL, contains acyltransferase and SGNH-hydrolase domains [Quadrisphaera granulorum]|uniref:Peptidoglycan/LPS O-acetylase OafA/YrhL n=1 Tax=Quadrisphaera granulorum TaxID=317664 RepID=A0A316AE31_9ACTN|nr:acyltransferase family protein [Quadrisphaera granulorum]PWJ56036.1 peptidoglycan/LPS O-acetylase OafA/YrhL [Quadrisphaera granulorum]SZE94670.1 Peptidoglycan/LPS O-acetylase OafA/YrhL, contains acyltransferase and SGNH-hydrolase domains [Quadrisphaera granulorum]